MRKSYDVNPIPLSHNPLIWKLGALIESVDGLARRVPEGVGVPEGLSQVVFADLNGVDESVSVRKSGGDGGGKSASRAV